MPYIFSWVLLVTTQLKWYATQEEWQHLWESAESRKWRPQGAVAMSALRTNIQYKFSAIFSWISAHYSKKMPGKSNYANMRLVATSEKQQIYSIRRNFLPFLASNGQFSRRPTISLPKCFAKSFILVFMSRVGLLDACSRQLFSCKGYRITHFDADVNRKVVLKHNHSTYYSKNIII